MIAFRIQVYGKVQGVFYRASAKSTADELGLVGWVKNELDGSVWIEVEGGEKQVEAFIEWCDEGPEFSKVQEVKTERIGPLDFSEFKIRH